MRSFRRDCAVVDPILKKIDEQNLPNLWNPARDGFVEVEAISILGSDKLDLKGLKETDLAKFAPQKSRTPEGIV